MEGGFMMFIHSAIISIIIYVIMKFLLKQPEIVSQNRSVLIGALILIYMVLFGHSFPPGKINPNIF
jgi:putative effector of murein hydrolase